MRRLNCPRQSPSQHRLPDFLFPERLFLPHLPCRFTHNLEKPAAGNPESKNQTDRKPDAYIFFFVPFLPRSFKTVVVCRNRKKHDKIDDFYLSDVT
ncbi:hypothetical protein CDAR_73471 [Caerostris darwini]|uniref:Uncharacterized protein n=1 Tax=Caerostris darwini TaxID=1538125 RepID=A0AAV4VKV3_9ARAC|nr:hypothetical protein CDAR_73471 [Caerostris darwini]